MCVLLELLHGPLYMYAVNDLPSFKITGLSGMLSKSGVWINDSSLYTNKQIHTVGLISRNKHKCLTNSSEDWFISLSSTASSNYTCIEDQQTSTPLICTYVHVYKHTLQTCMCSFFYKYSH